MAQLPQEFLTRMQDMLGDEFDRYSFDLWLICVVACDLIVFVM